MPVVGRRCSRTYSDGAIEALLAAGADPNVQDADGQTPLFKAATEGSVETIKALLAAGACAESDPFRNSELLTAAEENDLEAIEALLAAGVCADPGPFLDSKLLSAAGRNDVEAIEALLAAGADPNVQSSGGVRTALYNAAQAGNVEAIEALVAAGRTSMRRIPTVGPRCGRRCGRPPWTISRPSRR